MQPNDQQSTDANSTIPVETNEVEVTNTVTPVENTTEASDSIPLANQGTTVTTVEPTVIPSEPVADTVAPISTPPPAEKRRFSKKLKLLLVAVMVVLLLAAGSAGAYFGLILPNKPENVLKSAISNTLQERQVSFDGSTDIQAADSSKPGAMTATSVTFKGAADLDKNISKAEIAVTMSGVKVQGEVRYVDQTAYIKLGDLGAIKNMATAYSPEAAGVINKVENQWIEFDKTIIKQANADCVLDAKLTFTDADLTMLSEAYSRNMFAIIQNTSSEDVNGQSATKFELALDDNTMAEYAKSLEQLSVVKQLKDCSKEIKDPDYDSLKDGDTTPLSIWVDKATKRIVKLSSHTTDYDAKEANIKGTASVTLSYGPVSVEKPENAKPIMTLFSEFAPLFNSGVRGASSDNPLSLLGL